MPLLKMTPFTGMVPRTGPRLLPDSGAQDAYNVKLQSGELRPLRNPALHYVPEAPKTNPATSIFLARSGVTSTSWFSWPIDVDCVRVPLPTDVESRFCWTGDGPPKLITYTNAVAGGADNYPTLANELTLGIPTPTVACSVTTSGGAGVDVTRFYRYTFMSQYGEESGPSPVSAEHTGKIDATWSIGATTALQGFPANSGSGTATATRFTNSAAALHWLRVGDEVYFGGAPTVARTVTAVFSTAAFDVTGASIAAETSWTRKTPWNTSGMTRNLYRTTGTTGTYQLVAESVGTTYSDTLLDSQIPGDDLITEDWAPPPVGLTGLCVHSSGALAGFVNNLLCFSVPLQPHAWPEAYQLSSGYNGVGVAAFGSSVVMATQGPPFIATGVDPESMTGEEISGMYPCLSKRSVASIGNGIIYASRYGITQVGVSGVSMLTEGFYTRDEWETLNPSTMVCAVANGRIYVAYTKDDASIAMLIFDGQLHTGATVQATTLYAESGSGELYLTTAAGILEWDSPTQVPLQGNWRSKQFVLPSPVNIGAGKIDYQLAISQAESDARLAEIAAVVAVNEALVTEPLDDAEALAIGASFNALRYNTVSVGGSELQVPPDQPPSNIVSVTLYADDDVVASRVVTDTDVFRLPAGYKRDVFSVEITTQCAVQEVRLAETPNELRQA
jgi:hypothetical protein